MWSNRLLQSTSMSTVAPVSKGACRKWTAVGPLRVTRSTSTPAIWGRHGNETWWHMGMRLVVQGCRNTFFYLGVE